MLFFEGLAKPSVAVQVEVLTHARVGLVLAACKAAGIGHDFVDKECNIQLLNCIPLEVRCDVRGTEQSNLISSEIGIWDMEG